MDGSLQERRLAYRRAVQAGIGASIVVHLLVLLVLARSLSLAPAEPREQRQTVDFQGPIVLNVGRIVPASETPEEGIQLPPEEDEEPRPDDDERAPQQPGAVALPSPAVRGEGDQPRLTNAERLQPHEGDERLYKEFPDDQVPEYLASNPYAAYEGEIRARLSVMLDSLNLSEEQRRRAVEWLTGDEGEEWGISEDGIHLGGILIPMNVGALLQEEGPSGRESRQEVRDLGQIRLQDLLGEAEDIQKERGRQMRERSKEELERRLRDSLEAANDSTKPTT
jgi:hypothetical protein